jgi:twinkle protein
MTVVTLENDAIEAARFHRIRRENPWAIAGLYRFDDLPKHQPLQTWRTGFPDWNGVALAAGMVSIATGLPGSGKTHLMAQIWHHIVGKYGLVAMIASFECAPNPYYVRYLREFHARRREAEMSEKQLREADQYIRDHYRFLHDPQERPTLEWFKGMAEIAVAREGVKVIQLDPWNRLESQRSPKETEPEYVARCLREVTVFAKDTGCHVQIIAHPAKRLGARREMPPDLEDVAGAMHWWNMPDQGFVVHRSKAWDDGRRCYDATFTHRKARFEELGYPCSMNVRFNPQSRVFESVINPASMSNTNG